MAKNSKSTNKAQNRSSQNSMTNEASNGYSSSTGNSMSNSLNQKSTQAKRGRNEATDCGHKIKIRQKPLTEPPHWRHGQGLFLL